MKKNVRSNIWAMAVAGSVFFMSACNNSDYTKSPVTEGGNAPANTDTTMSNTPMKDTTSATVSGSTSDKTAHKKGKVTIGNMSEKRTTAIKPDKDGVYEMTDTRPMYPGGQAALENYVNNNIEYQQPAIDESTQGTVNVQFVVDENGNVTNAKEIGKELGNGLDQEAVRVISSMPKWTPGKVKGKNVKTRVVLPITYKIEQ
jgi:periplasmic protein TonB